MTNFNKKEAMLYGLSEDFECIMYANLDTGYITDYRSCITFDRLLGNVRNLNSFDIKIKAFAEHIVYAPDVQKWTNALSKKTIIKELEKNKVYYVNIRFNFNNSIIYYQIKIVKDVTYISTGRTIIIGLHNIDDETRKEIRQREKIEQLQKRESVYRRAICSDSCGYFEVNVTQDLVIGDIYKFDGKTETSISEEIGASSAATFTEAIDIYAKQRLVSNEKEFREFNNCKNITAKCYLGEIMPMVSFWVQSIDGNKICLRETMFLSKDESTNEISAFAVFKDITNDQLAKDALVSDALQAQGASKAKSAFLFNMSHDIRTPMNAIIGFSNMARKYFTEDPNKAYESLLNLEIAGNQLLCLINDVLDMASIESQKLTIDAAPADLREVVDNLVRIITPSCQAKDIKLRLNISCIRHPGIYLDVPHFNRIILNILNNSVKYTREGGNISFTVVELPCDKENYALFNFVIADSGIGISKEFINEIFSAFSRERTTTASGIEGAGLGLSIVKGLLNLMDGEINIDSEPGKGTTVRIELPLRLSDDESFDDTDYDGSDDIAGIKVLLVEDNEMNRLIAKDILEGYGAIVYEAEDGAVALDKVKNSAPGDFDVILMDIQMPYMNGYTAAHEIRNLTNKRLANIPIIAMTANAFEEDKRRALASGMNAHLAKPIDVPVMLRTIRSYVSLRETEF